eukprot:CAMPEP_0198681740 /NCGR_PEP_ID=MMETSP1468-20131203/7415_1 /TAXON_ID=1461545 /ORGANISM="Mantoniella sp, Strain CCMP1436" /LENGTH=42 /DNA_ID= /DNA_START= /DNA_END= /DNA_ORIENTATION=
MANAVEAEVEVAQRGVEVQLAPQLHRALIGDATVGAVQGLKA